MYNIHSKTLQSDPSKLVESIIRLSISHMWRIQFFYRDICAHFTATPFEMIPGTSNLTKNTCSKNGFEMYGPCFKGSSVKTCLAVVIILQPKHCTLWEIPQIYHIFALFDTTQKNGNLMIPTSPGWPSGALPVASFRRSLACSSAAFWSSVALEVASFPQMLVDRTCFVTTEIPCRNLVFLRELFKS